MVKMSGQGGAASSDLFSSTMVSRRADLNINLRFSSSRPCRLYAATSTAYTDISGRTMNSRTPRVLVRTSNVPSCRLGGTAAVNVSATLFREDDLQSTPAFEEIPSQVKIQYARILSPHSATEYTRERHQFLRKAERAVILFIINQFHSSSGIQMPV